MSLRALRYGCYVTVVALVAGFGAIHAEPTTAKATLGAGCFWCMEAVFERVPGVLDVVSGYAGGTVENPSYQQVSEGNTGHAEVIQITYDPAKVSYEALLEVFWKSHDATDERGVEPDFGSQYRSIILCHDEAQRAAALKSRDQEQEKLPKRIATQITMFEAFYPAEAHHQDYVRLNPADAYVRGVSNPRLKKLGLLGKPVVVKPTK